MSRSSRQSKRGPQGRESGLDAIVPLRAGGGGDRAPLPRRARAAAPNVHRSHFLPRGSSVVAFCVRRCAVRRLAMKQPLIKSNVYFRPLQVYNEDVFDLLAPGGLQARHGATAPKPPARGSLQSHLPSLRPTPSLLPCCSHLLRFRFAYVLSLSCTRAERSTQSEARTLQTDGQFLPPPVCLTTMAPADPVGGPREHSGGHVVCQGPAGGGRDGHQPGAATDIRVSICAFPSPR